MAGQPQPSAPLTPLELCHWRWQQRMQFLELVIALHASLYVTRIRPPIGNPKSCPRRSELQSEIRPVRQATFRSPIGGVAHTVQLRAYSFASK